MYIYKWNNTNEEREAKYLIRFEKTRCQWGLVGLGVWFSLRVREVPGSNPGRAQVLSAHAVELLLSQIHPREIGTFAVKLKLLYFHVEVCRLCTYPIQINNLII